MSSIVALQKSSDLKIVMWQRKVVWFDNLVASLCVTSLRGKHEKKTCSLCNSNYQFRTQFDFKRQKAAN